MHPIQHDPFSTIEEELITTLTHYSPTAMNFVKIMLDCYGYGAARCTLAACWTLFDDLIKLETQVKPK